jgi:sec-independent protein translocase protein TatB
MFEFDAGKLVIIGIVALIVIGPKELPRVLRQAGQAMAKLRRMATEFQGQFMEAMREAELADIKDEAAKLAASAKIDSGLDPVAELRSELTRAIDEAGTANVATSGSGAATAEAPAQDLVPNTTLEPRDVREIGALSADLGEAMGEGEPLPGPEHGPPTGGDQGIDSTRERDLPVTRT